jgi:hypothetical protein
MHPVVAIVLGLALVARWKPKDVIAVVKALLRR